MSCRIVVWAVLPVFICFPAFARTKKTSHASPSKIKSDYVSALATANRFLGTWQSQDEDAGMIMLTNDAKHRTTENQLDEFFSSGINSAFEINRGKKLSGVRFSFPVVLFMTGKKGIYHPRSSKIVLIKTGNDNWAVDKLP